MLNLEDTSKHKTLRFKLDIFKLQQAKSKQCNNKMRFSISYANIIARGISFATYFVHKIIWWTLSYSILTELSFTYAVILFTYEQHVFTVCVLPLSQLVLNSISIISFNLNYFVNSIISKLYFKKISSMLIHQETISRCLIFVLGYATDLRFIHSYNNSIWPKKVKNY